jgi:glycosyltransferase involved in cell wall biosynthesis
LKKRLFVALTAPLGLHRGITFQTSTRLEAEDARRVLGRRGRKTRNALDLPIPVSGLSLNVPERVRAPGEPLKLVFLSRIHPKKNLDYALRALAHVTVPIEYDVYGPASGAEEEQYWAECQAIIAGLPANVRVNYKGWVSPAEVPGVMAEHDLFYFPTRGENYGHVIAEAMSVGTPALLANTTPWLGLEADGVGWDLPLDDPKAFALRIDACYAKSPEEYAAWRRRVRAYTAQKLADPESVEQNRKLFQEAAAGR